MTVQELIDKLQDVENKDLPVYVYDNTEYIQGHNLANIMNVDLTISDRVDLNIWKVMC